jgi:uncharacterized protein with GYD domain
MTIYIALFNLTEAGIKAAKDSPRRLDAAKKLLADMGGEMKQSAGLALVYLIVSGYCCGGPNCLFARRDEWLPMFR